MTKQTSILPNVCTGLIVAAVSALACALILSAVLFLIVLR
jgi:hypothetical protein